MGMLLSLPMVAAGLLMMMLAYRYAALEKHSQGRA
jgi:prolipoprotein diacylglyceryltransferase